MLRFLAQNIYETTGRRLQSRMEPGENAVYLTLWTPDTTTAVERVLSLRTVYAERAPGVILSALVREMGQELDRALARAQIASAQMADTLTTPSLARMRTKRRIE